VTTTTTTTLPPLAGTTFSSLCSLMMRPVIMTGVLRDIFMRHFTAWGNIEEPDLRQLVWRSGETTSILIESAYRWRPELTEFRPAVLIKRNTLQNQRRGIGDQQMGNLADAFGHEHYATFWVGSHTLFCVGGSGAQAELLGTEVQRHLTEFSRAFLMSFGLLRFQVTQVGAVAELEESRENWVVPVTVGYGYEERWKIIEQAPRLHSVSLSLITEC